MTISRVTFSSKNCVHVKIIAFFKLRCLFCLVSHDTVSSRSFVSTSALWLVAQCSCLKCNLHILWYQTSKRPQSVHLEFLNYQEIGKNMFVRALLALKGTVKCNEIRVYLNTNLAFISVLLNLSELHLIIFLKQILLLLLVETVFNCSVYCFCKCIEALRIQFLPFLFPKAKHFFLQMRRILVSNFAAKFSPSRLN